MLGLCWGVALLWLSSMNSPPPLADLDFEQWLMLRSNGGPTGVIYELIVMSFFFCLIAASLAELASSVPSSSGVYHWASITPGPKYGRICGWFAGWLNFFAWSLQNSELECLGCSSDAVWWLIRV